MHITCNSYNELHELQILITQASLTAEVETIAAVQKSIISQVETVQSDVATQSEVVKQLVTALHEQTEMVMEQQRQIKESW